MQHTYYLHLLRLPRVCYALTVLAGWLERMEQRDLDPDPALFPQAHSSWTMHPSPPVEVSRPSGVDATRHTRHRNFSNSSPPAAFRTMSEFTGLSSAWNGPRTISPVSLLHVQTVSSYDVLDYVLLSGANATPPGDYDPYSHSFRMHAR
ncbi:hypothetical protein P692DRAFT_20882119 [Suillus brevipes Sb2]|nr:hypothetical protein P692DRAFT_20882119 [Suillus brevipes Sb2]